MDTIALPTPTVAQLRQSLLWPLRLIAPSQPSADSVRARREPWRCLSATGSAWQPVTDEWDSTDQPLQERHYHEFVTFLPYVQRFLYGEGAGQPASMRVFRRQDVAALEVVLQADQPALRLEVVHADLYFFYDVDLIFLHIELAGSALSLAQASELLYRLGRGYPGGWDAQGQALHAPVSVRWLAADGSELARSDAQDRGLFLRHVGQHRSPRIAADWAWLLQPLHPDLPEHSQRWRFRQIEYYRMPLMAWLALDAPRQLSRADWVRLGLVVGGAGTGAGLPYGPDHLADFEAQHCYDRFWSDAGAAPHTRYLVSGHALVVVGDAQASFFTCAERGVLAQFRHEHFLLFLIAHFQKAALLMFSDRLAEALRALDVGDADSVRRFKRNIRGNFEGFLRFTHRYWFREIAEQAQARALFHLCSRHLDSERLYAEVKERIRDMSDYLDADSLRRQANTVVRLTVVTILGMIGTITTGVLGMNLFDEADAPLGRQLALFALVFIASASLTIYTMSKSKRLSDFLDALSDERLSPWQKLGALLRVWQRGAGD